MPSPRAGMKPWAEAISAVTVPASPAGWRSLALYCCQRARLMRPPWRLWWAASATTACNGHALLTRRFSAKAIALLDPPGDAGGAPPWRIVAALTSQIRGWLGVEPAGGPGESRTWL